MDSSGLKGPQNKDFFDFNREVLLEHWAVLTLLFHSHSLKLGRIGDDSESVGVRACTGLQCGPIVFIKSKRFN